MDDADNVIILKGSGPGSTEGWFIQGCIGSFRLGLFGSANATGSLDLNAVAALPQGFKDSE